MELRRNVWMDGRGKGFLFTCLAVLVVVSTTFAQGSGRVVSMVSEEEEDRFSPYLIGYVGGHEPLDDDYSLVFGGPMVRYGGGFGVRMKYIGMEFIYRTGKREDAILTSEAQRNLYWSSSELVARLYTYFKMGHFSFPIGFGGGINSMTVDRGYAGIFDRFGGDGLYLGPFVGIQYEVVESLQIGFEVEYAFSEAGFSGSEAWRSRYAYLVDIGRFDPNGANFWDTVGGTDTEFDAGGLVFALRATVYIPTYSEQ
ncbi:hypothetical protein GF324_12765 [bacterium]|nr:hypothetical protein [bacterium]